MCSDWRDIMADGRDGAGQARRGRRSGRPIQVPGPADGWDAWEAFSSFQVELPSRRWLLQAAADDALALNGC